MPPTNLWNYFSKHLKVIATIGTDERESQWAIFFGKSQEDVGDFPGRVNATLDALTWESERPLWLIPLSPSAKEEAEKFVADGVDPEIDYSAITVRNRGKGNDTGSWDTNYDFWYEDTADWSSDPILTLGTNEGRIKLNSVGSWFNLEAKLENEDTYEEAWPVWITTKNGIATTKRLIVFPAPACQIVSDQGVYLDHELWFGVRSEEADLDKEKRNRPFIAFSTTQICLKVGENGCLRVDGGDCPIVWRKTRRINDIIQPTTVINSLYSTDTWKGQILLETYEKENGDVGNISPEIVKNFNTSVTPFTSQWLIYAKSEDSKTYFYPVYFRSYTLKSISEPTFKQIYGTTNKTQLVRIVQINPLEELKLLVKLSSIGDEELKIWNNKTAAIAQGLWQIDASSPVGITPQLTLSSGTNCEYIGVWSKAYDGANSTDVTSVNLDETAFIQNNQILKQNPGKLATISLPLLQPQTYSPASDQQSQQGITLSKATILFQVSAPLLNDNGTLFQLVVSSYTIQPPKPVVLRDGALAFTLTTQANPDENLPPTQYGRFRLSLQFVKTQRPFFWWQWYSNLDDFVAAFYAVEDFSLPVHLVEAAGQDVTSTDRLVAPRSLGAVNEGFGERKEPSLVIPLNTNEPNESDTATQKQNFLLTLSESVNVGQNYRLDLRLQEFNPDVSPEDGKASTHIRAVILDANPQFMGLIDARFLQQPGYDDGAWVVARRSPFSVEAGGWEILDDGASSEGFYLVLPAQAIGEAYVKTDVKPDGTLPSGEPSEPEQPIEYRFGAPSVLRLAPTRLDRRYVATPWNLRRIWGSPGDSSPGIPLLEAQVELLYGLMGYLKPEKAIIAELASKLGDVPVPPTGSIAWAATTLQQTAFRKSWQRYLQFYRAWQSRLAILEPALTDAFASAVFDENLQFSPRVKLESSDGVTWARTKGADLKEPMSLVPVPDETPADPLLVNKIIAAHSPTGLAGGFQYGFESKAIYTEFWREALANGSSSAELKELAFSSLGGWGKQTARFANDKTVIKANVAMGRTHFYAVERIGRIGVFWHKAKHVIEYERTVVPSLQFSQQPAHLGRPLVRKVREYIEILEPTRSYPDLATDAPDAPGSVTSCFFKSIIIPVQSSWGHDVRDVKKSGSEAADLIGWEVPLWKPGADPRVYPKPQVQLTLLSPPDSDERAIFVNLSEPQNLWFYTDTRQNAQTPDGNSVVITTDVHAWPPVSYVDFTNLPEPEQYDIPPSASTDSSSISIPLPKAIDVFPGFERFTFRIDRHEIPASVAGRYYTNSGISGKLRTVSMMRSSPDKTVAKTWWSNPNGSTQQKAAKDVLASLVSGNNSLLARSANGFGNVKTLTEVHDWIKGKLSSDQDTPISQKIKSLKESGVQLSVEKPNLHYFDDLWAPANGFSYPIKWVWRETLESAEGFINTIHGIYEEQRQALKKSTERLVSDANHSINDAKNYLTLFIDRLFESYFDLEFTLDSAFPVVSTLIYSGLNSLLETSDELFNNLIDTLDKINPDEIIDAAKIDEIKSEIDQAITKIRTDSNHLLDTLSTEWNVDASRQTINKILDDFTENLNKFAQDLQDDTQKTDEVLSQFKLTLSDTNAQIKQELTLLQEKISTFIDDARITLSTINSDVKTIHDQLNKQISEFIQESKANLNEITKETMAALDAAIETEWNTILELLKADLSLVLYDEPKSSGVFFVLQTLDTIIQNIDETIKRSLLEVFETIDDNLDSWLKTLTAYQRLEKAIGNGDEDAILNASVALADSINDEFGRLAGEVAQKVREFETITDAAQDVVQVGKQTLSNFRSVWEEFTAPGMGLNRKTVALLVKTDWKDVEQRLSLTPFISQVKQFDKQLDGLGLHLPVVAITDRLLPASPDWHEMENSLLSKFDVSTLFSDIGGIRLDGLLEGVKMDDSMRDKIKVTHGFDKQNLMAWANAEVDLPFNEPLQLMSIGALGLTLEKGRFIGKVRLEGDIDGKVRKTNEGELNGSWAIKVSNTVLMTFRDAKVIFKNDKLSFDLDPKRMEMSGLLQMLTQATQTLMATGAVSNSDSEGNTVDVFKVGLIQVGNIPTGIMAQLNIPPISVGGGTTAITNLSFGGFFLLSFLDEDLNFKFKMGIGFYLGKKEAPFNITIFILGGGGYVDCALYLEPGLFGQKKGLTVDFSMSILVSAALAVNLGWIKGGVAIMLGLELDYHRRPQADRDNTVSFSFYLYVVGQVDILNIVSVYLSLLLQATYEQGTLKGTGQVVLTIRICRFFKIKVNKTYTKVFTGGNTQKTQAVHEAPAVALVAGPKPAVATTNDTKAKAILASLA